MTYNWNITNENRNLLSQMEKKINQVTEENSAENYIQNQVMGLEIRKGKI